MKGLFILVFLVSCTAINKPRPKHNIKIEKSTSSTMYTSQVGECYYRVNILHYKMKTHLDIKSPSGMSCPKDFKLSKKEYYLLIDQALSEFPAETITYVMLPPLEYIQPDFSWNHEILKLANSSKIWKKFILNYPKNTEGLSSNKIFVDTVNQKIPQGLIDFLKPYKFNLKLRSVEKVFATRIKRLKQVKDKSMYTRSYSLFYDAGVYVFKNRKRK